MVESFLAENTEQRDKWMRLLENVIDELHKNRATLKRTYTILLLINHTDLICIFGSGFVFIA